ncbi:MAG: immunity 22 family protein [Anaerorhabdus sp.]
MGTKNENVAIWLGNFVDKNSFDEFIKVHYDLIETAKNLDVINSTFDNTFKLGEYNREIVEINFNQSSESMHTLLKHASYLEDYISKLSNEKCRYNCAILIYDYFYEGTISTYKEGENKLDFFENVKYKKDVDVSVWVKRARERMSKLDKGEI